MASRHNDSSVLSRHDSSVRSRHSISDSSVKTRRSDSSVMKTPIGIMKKVSVLQNKVTSDDSEQQTYEQRREMEREQLEDKWRSKVKQVLLIANEKVTTAELKMHNQQEENDALARSNNRLKEEMDNMNEKYRILKENSNAKNEMLMVGNELRGLRKQMKKHEDLIMATKKDNENLNQEVIKISVQKEVALCQSMEEQLSKAAMKAEMMEKELANRERKIQLYEARITTVKEEQEKAVWRSEMMEATMAVGAMILVLGCWRLMKTI